MQLFRTLARLGLPLAAAASLPAACAAPQAGNAVSSAGPSEMPTQTELKRVLSGMRRLAWDEKVSDPAAIEAALGLPGLTAGAKWEVPSQRDRGRRYVSWDAPEGSPIRNVVIQPGVEWSLFPGAPGGTYVHDDLTVVFREGACPSYDSFEKAFGVKMEVMMMLPPHGGELYPARSFEVPTRSGSLVRISVNPCSAFLASPSNTTLRAARR